MQFRLGSSFDYGGTASAVVNDTAVTNFAGWTATSQIRDAKTNTLIADLNFEWLDAPTGRFRLWSQMNTAIWSVGKARLDILFVSPGGQKVPSGILDLDLGRGVTV